MIEPPDDPRRLERALELTDRMERVKPRPDARPSGDPAAPGAGGWELLEGIGRVFRAGGPAGPGAPVGGLFRWAALEVRRLLGRGRFGEVFAAWEPRLQREVALKLRLPEAGALHWLDEARNLARVRHPNVVDVFGADLCDGRAGIWMELIDGGTLEEALATKGALEATEVLRIGRDLASALDAVHRAGLVHGDLKASNVMLERPSEGATRTITGGPPPKRVVLMDFSASTIASGGGGARFATPLYTAPEVLDGAPPTPAADLYSLGVLLYRLLTGRYPVEAEDPGTLRARHARGEREPLVGRRQGLPVEVVIAIERALEPDPARRFASAAAMRDALARLGVGPRPRAAP